MNIINYSNHFIDKKDKKNVIKALESEHLTKGKYLISFEKKIKKFVNSKFCLALSNASAALLVSLRAMNLKKNDIVWCSDNTYISSINCALHLDLKIDLVDINLNNFNISIKNLKKKLIQAKHNSKLPKIIIITHIGGYPCDLKVYCGKKIGNCMYSDLAIFSFHPSKTITTGEGGAITTNNKSLYNNIKLLRENGHDFSKNKFQNIDLNYYNIKKLGYNLRLNEISCALGLSQINKISKFIKYKNKLAKNYYSKLDKKKFHLPRYELKNTFSSWHLFIIRINFENINKSKNQIIKYLKKNNIYVKTHYPPLSTFHLIKKNIKKSFKNYFSLEYYKEAISIPIYYGLSFKDQNKIIKILNKI